MKRFMIMLLLSAFGLGAFAHSPIQQDTTKHPKKTRPIKKRDTTKKDTAKRDTTKRIPPK